MLDTIINLLTNPIILLIILTPIMLLIGIVLGNYLSQPRKNLVMKLDPESHRGVQLEVNSEDTVNVYCKSVGDMPNQKFIKRLNPYNVMRKGWMKIQNFAIWFGRYGTAYVHQFDNKPVELTFQKAVHNVFGEKYYKQIPKDIKSRIEDGSIGVTIEFPNDPLTPVDAEGKELPSISEDDIKRDKDDKAMANLWDSYDKEKKRSALNMIAFIGCGIAIGVVLSLLFRWGAPVVIENVVPT